MKIFVAENGCKGHPDANQMRLEVIPNQEIAKTSEELSNQTRILAGDKPVSDSPAVSQKPNNEKLYDLCLLEEMDDNEYLSEILTIFLNNTPNDLKELRRVCISNKFDAVYQMAHKLKSSTGLLKMNYLLVVLIKIEQAAKAGKNDGLAKLAELANEEYKKVEIPLKEQLRNIQAALHAA